MTTKKKQPKEQKIITSGSLFNDSNRNNLANIKSGLNLQLPDANLKDERNADKLAFYQEADADSLKRDELLRNDP